MITIVDKQGNKVPFLLWPHQRKVLKHMGPGIVVVIKGRQMGLTTLNLADKLCKARLFENRECLIINKDLEDSKVMFAKVRELDADLGPDFQGDKKTDTGMMLHYADNNCMMRITTAGQTESVTERKARSSTVYDAIITEAAYIKFLAKLLQGMVLAPGGELVLESTSKGPRGAFPKLCMDTWKAGEEIDINVRQKGPVKIIFCSALEQVDKRVRIEPGEVLDVPDDAEEALEEEKIRAYGKDKGFKTVEIVEFLKYRRATMAGYLTDKDRKTHLTPAIQFKRENPVEFHDAFTDSGANYFDMPRLAAIKALLETEKITAHKFGILRRHGEAPELVAPSPGNTVTIWAGPKFVGMPQDGYQNRYLVFADVGEGKASSDADCIYVFDRLRYCVVATAYGRMGAEQTAYTMVNLADLYFGAWISWDCTGIGKELRPHFLRMKYPKLRSSKQVDDPLVDSGWLGLQWGKNNRYDALALLKTMWENQEFTIPDLEAFAEAQQFGKDDDEEFPCAAEGFNDDRIMSLAGMVYENQFIPSITRSAPMKPFDKKKPLLERLRRHAPEATKPTLSMLDE
ncbi:MAG: hypothetical protein ABIY63_13405 [Fibrobacteria bacterium]